MPRQASQEPITGNANSIGAYSRINPRASSLANNIAFNGMLVNGATVSDAASDPQNDANGLGKTATQLASQSTYETGLGWGFAAVWEMRPPELSVPLSHPGKTSPTPVASIRPAIPVKSRLFFIPMTPFR